MIVFDLSWVQGLQFALAVVMPLAVGLVTKRSTSSAMKAVLLLALSGLSSLGAELLNALTSNTSFDLGTALLLMLGTFITGVALHYGLWVPTKATETVQGMLVTDSPGVDRVPGPDHRRP